MNVAVAVIQGKLGRFPSFESSLDKMVEHTARTTGRMPMVARSFGLNPAEGRNQAVRDFLSGDGEALLFLDDDQIVEPDCMLRLAALLEESDYAVAAPLVLKVEAPFQSVGWTRNGRLAAFVPWGKTGVHEVDEIGTGVLMVRRSVFEALPAPWFLLGQIDPVQMMEDVYFARNVRAAGFRIAIDVDHAAGHTAPFTVWPSTKENCVLLADQRGHTLAIPADALVRIPAPQPVAAGI